MSRLQARTLIFDRWVAMLLIGLNAGFLLGDVMIGEFALGLISAIGVVGSYAYLRAVRMEERRIELACVQRNRI